jgi:hypothetical protein
VTDEYVGTGVSHFNRQARFANVCTRDLVACVQDLPGHGADPDAADANEVKVFEIVKFDLTHCGAVRKY